jgi:serine/threonine kinase 16
MVLMVGVARALKGMHQYRMPKGLGGKAVGAKAKARAVREEAANADQDAARRAGKGQKQKRREMVAEPQDQEGEEEMPLMEGEVTRAQEGVGEGEIRAYAHRDIKPGKLPFHLALRKRSC